MELVVRRIEFTRRYTLELLEGLDDSDWFWMPDAYPTHIAWQVGHIAMSHYGLTLFRQRGRAEVDSSLMSGKFRKLFMKGTTPKSGAENYPTPTEILDVLAVVFKQTIFELPDFEEHLDEPVRRSTCGLRDQVWEPFCLFLITRCCMQGRLACCVD